MTQWFDAAADDLKDGAKVRCEIAGRRVLVIRSEGEYFACDACCTHEGMELDDGAVEMGTIECPLHGSVFDLKTGVAEYGPAEEPLAVHSCKVENGRVLIQLMGAAHGQ